MSHRHLPHRVQGPQGRGQDRSLPHRGRGPPLLPQHIPWPQPAHPQVLPVLDGGDRPGHHRCRLSVHIRCADKSVAGGFIISYDFLIFSLSYFFLKKILSLKNFGFQNIFCFQKIFSF